MKEMKAMKEMNVETAFINLCKRFHNLDVCRDFSLTFAPGRISCLLGPSGCGKTTLLNMAAGLVRVDSGEIRGFDGKDMAYIFQEPRLLPWKTTAENIDFVLKDHCDKTERNSRVNDLLEMVGLSDFAGYYPKDLSGGMKQRAAIARAFARGAGILLMDEPFNGIDHGLKQSIMELFLRLRGESGKTVLLVTHDVEDALFLGDDIFLLTGPPLRLEAHYPGMENAEKESIKQKILQKLLHKNR